MERLAGQRGELPVFWNFSAPSAKLVSLTHRDAMNKNPPHEPLRHSSPKSTLPLAAPQLARLSDRDLLDGWRRDDSRAAFDELVRRYRVMVLSVCRRHCYHDQDADDAFQMTWFCLAQTASQIRHPERLAGWLHRVAARAARVTLKQRRRSEDSQRSGGFTKPIEINEIPGNDEEAFAVLSRRHEAIVLDEELCELPEHYRTAIVMHLIEGDSYQNIAERLESTVGAVRGYVQRGKLVLATRLRHRGIVPVLAYAAVQLLQVSESVAAEVTRETLPAGTELSSAPPGSSTDSNGPPVNFSSLSKSGNSMLRISSRVAAACLATAVVAGLCMSQIRALGGNGERPLTLRIADSGNDSGSDPQVVAGQIAATSTPNQEQPSTAPGQESAGDVKRKVPEYRTRVAEQVAEKLDAEVSISLQTSLDSLAEELTAQLGIPVHFEANAIEQAGTEWTQTTVTFKSDQQPLRSSLRRFLQPLGLRAEVQDEGLVITTDFTELTRRGILTDKWVGLSDEFIARVDEVLATEVVLPREDISLDRAIADFSRTLDFPMFVNAVALEGIGLTQDTNVRGRLRLTTSQRAKGWDGRIFSEALVSDPEKKVILSDAEPGAKEDAKAKNSETELRGQKLPLGNALDFLLSDLGLVYTVRDGVIFVTTLDDAETQLLPRLYFLEGTGLPRGDVTSAISMIQPTIEPDTWEILGGTGTIVPVGGGEYARPAVLVSTTFGVHQQIADLMKTLRETHVGPDPVWSGNPPQSAMPAIMQPAGSSGGMF